MNSLVLSVNKPNQRRAEPTKGIYCKLGLSQVKTANGMRWYFATEHCSQGIM